MHFLTACLDDAELRALSARPDGPVGSVAGLLVVRMRGAERGRLEAILALLCSCVASAGGERVWEYAVAGAGSGRGLPESVTFLAEDLMRARLGEVRAERARLGGEGTGAGAMSKELAEEGRLAGLLGLFLGTMPARLAGALAGAVPAVCPELFEKAALALELLAETGWEDQQHYALLVDYAGAHREELARGCAALAEACRG